MPFSPASLEITQHALPDIFSRGLLMDFSLLHKQGAKMPRQASGTSMQQYGTARVGVATQQVALNLSQQQLRELLTALMNTPTGVVLQVGYALRLFVAVIKLSLPTGDRIGGSEGRGGLAAVSKTSRRDIRAAAGAPPAWQRSSLTVEQKEQAVAIIAAATKNLIVKQPKGAEKLKVKVGSGAVKESGGGGKVKQARNLQGWAAKARRTVPSLVELLDSGATVIGTEHARLIRSHANAIPMEKATRVSMASVVRPQGVDVP